MDKCGEATSFRLLQLERRGKRTCAQSLNNISLHQTAFCEAPHLARNMIACLALALLLAKTAVGQLIASIS
jgi:hypothetical protein